MSSGQAVDGTQKPGIERGLPKGFGGVVQPMAGSNDLSLLGVGMGIYYRRGEEGIIRNFKNVEEPQGECRGEDE